MALPRAHRPSLYSPHCAQPKGGPRRTACTYDVSASTFIRELLAEPLPCAWPRAETWDGVVLAFEEDTGDKRMITSVSMW